MGEELCFKDSDQSIINSKDKSENLMPPSLIVSPTKKRKVDVVSPSPATSRTSSCSDDHNVHESNESLRSEVVEVKTESSETEGLTSINGFIREGSMDSSSSSSYNYSKKKSPSKPRSVEKMPSAAELEEFFAAAEKSDQKRFAEKYNYDIVKDVPLEGKYQWVRLLP